MIARLFRCFVFCLSLVAAAQAAAGPRIWVALSDQGGPYEEAAAAVRAGMDGSADLRSEPWQYLWERKGEKPDLIVTVGVAAMDGTLERLAARDAGWSQVPVLAILVPQAVFEARRAHPAASGRPFGAVVLDQPLGRQLALIKRALPDRVRVGVVPGAQTRPLLSQLEREARSRGLQLVKGPEVRAPEDIYPSLREVLVEADVVLALPDPAIYNANTLQNILLATYRARVPLVAFSSAYVKAGALLALYSTPAQVARTAVEVLRQWQAGQGLATLQRPREFTAAVNPRVATSLQFLIDDEAALVADLRRLEGGR
ncbi:MAG: ABC transporter substrate-binding protein [Rhodocyclaceae bacterium]